MRLDEDRIWALLDEVGLGLDLPTYADELDPVVDAIVDGASSDVLEIAVDGAAHRVWDDDLRSEVSSLLDRYRAELVEQLETVDSVIGELVAPAPENLMARALVHRAPLPRSSSRRRRPTGGSRKLWRRGSPRPRRSTGTSIASEAAAELVGAVPIGEDEIEQGVERMLETSGNGDRPGQGAMQWLARALATDERRASLRDALDELRASLRDDETPQLRSAIAEILSAAPPADPADDGAWLAFVVALIDGDPSDHPGASHGSAQQRATRP